MVIFEFNNIKMMKLKYLSVLLLLITVGACKKENSIDLSGFDVRTDALTFKAGEEVTFRLTGDPSQLSFYSGEVGNSYNFKDEARVDEVDQLIFSFETHNTLTEVVNYQVMLSTDFNGIYDYENITAATWQNLSSRFNWAAPAVWPNGWEGSGGVNIVDVVEPGKPFYIAYKYVVPAIPIGTVPGRGWRTRAHILDLTTKYGYTSRLANYAGMSWKQVKKVEMTSSSVITSSIMLFGAPSTYREEYEEWGVSKAFSADEVNLGVDRSVPIKGYSDVPLNEYKHIYTESGNYRVTFVAANKTGYNDKEVVKHIDITIEP